MSIEQYNFAKLSDAERSVIIASQTRGVVGLLTEQIVALALDVQPSTLATWRSHGTGPDYVKLGKGVFYTVSALSAWVNTEAAKQRLERQGSQKAA